MANKCPKCHVDNPDTQSFCGDCGTQLPSVEEDTPSLTKTLETPQEELTTGSTFANRYQVIEELGKGGMGKIYKVLDKETNEKIALKLIKPEIASDKKTIERFRNELTTARKIGHRNVCRMYDLNREKRSFYITMEYVPGEDLKSFIRRSGQLAIGTTIRIAKQICEGLTEAHRLGVVHRDLKPSNIMIDKEGSARIMDFGIARSLKEKGITGAGVMIGTPEYMSPEQVEGKEVDQRSDIYSLGIILYEMVTGKVPFDGDTALSIAMKHKSEAPRSPKDFNSQIPDDLSGLILKCLKKERSERYQDVNELQLELENVESGIPTTSREIPKRKPVTSREITVTFGLKKLFIPALIIIALIAAAVIIWQFIPSEKFEIAPKIENSIAIIGFKNQTGDESYNYLQEAIPNLLITSLEQSGSHYVLTWERMNDLLKQLGKEDVEAVDKNLGFKICLMEGVESIVLGSIVKAGEMFATDVKVLDVESKKLLSSASSRGEGEGSIIRTQIDELSREISKGIGMSDQKAEQQRRISDVTTSSLEAYDYFLKGKVAHGKLYYEDAKNYFEKAVEHDPEFATAYFYLANSSSWVGDMKRRNEAYKKAREYLHKTSGKERLYLEARIARYLDGKSDVYMEKLKQIIKEYPREKGAYHSLGYYYQTRRNYNKAIEEYNKAIDLDPSLGLTLNQIGYTYFYKGDYLKAIEYFKRYISEYPDDANPYDSMGEVYFEMGRMEEAIAQFKQAVQVKPDFFISYNRIAYIYALKENYPLAQEWIEKGYNYAQSPGPKIESLLLNALIQYWRGRYEDSIQKLEEIGSTAETLQNSYAKNLCDVLIWWNYYENGQYERIIKHYETWSSFYKDNFPGFSSIFEAQYRIVLGLAELKNGKMVSAKSRLAEAKSHYPKMKLDPSNYIGFLYCLLDAEIALSENQPERVLEIFEKWEPYEGISLRSMPIVNQNIPYVERDIIARAYYQIGEIDKAVAEYERLTTFDPENKVRKLIHARYYYRLAKLYEQKGWQGKAIEHYEKFLDLWKDADPGMSEVDDARQRLAELKG